MFKFITVVRTIRDDRGNWFELEDKCKFILSLGYEIHDIKYSTSVDEGTIYETALIIGIKGNKKEL